MRRCRFYLSKVARSPWTIARLVVDRILVPLYVRLQGVELGPGCHFVGQPLAKLVPGSRVILGNNVNVLSRVNSNPAGLPHPTMLAALTRDSYIEIGEGTGISGASIVSRAGIRIGRHVLIGAGACIWDTDFHPMDPQKRREDQTRDACSAPVHIEDDVFIGARALILKGVRIGRGAVVGAGAVVTKSVDAYQMVAGNPAKVVGAVYPLKKVLENGETVHT